MSENDSQPQGWYASEDGTSRYWTGSEWVTPAAAPGARRERKPLGPKAKRNVIIAAIVAGILILGGGGGAWAAKSNADHVAAVKHAQQVKARHDAVAAAAKAAASKKAEAAAALQAEETLQKAVRADDIKQLEASVKSTAKKDVNDGVLDGPILDVTCTPLGGGSTDDLTQKSATFTCFAANKKNGDGTENGYNFSATMNWDTSEYTWRLGN